MLTGKQSIIVYMAEEVFWRARRETGVGARCRARAGK